MKAVQQHMDMVTGLLEATTGLQQRTSALLPTTGQEEEHLQGGSIEHHEHADHHEEVANERAAQDSKEEDTCSDAAFEELTSSGKISSRTYRMQSPMEAMKRWRQQFKVKMPQLWRHLKLQLLTPAFSTSMRGVLFDSFN